MMRSFMAEETTPKGPGCKGKVWPVGRLVGLGSLSHGGSLGNTKSGAGQLGASPPGLNSYGLTLVTHLVACQKHLVSEDQAPRIRVPEAFIKENVVKVVSEVEEEQRKKERERRLSASSEKMKELSKFLKKCDLNFRLELRELQKRAVVDQTELKAEWMSMKLIPTQSIGSQSRAKQRQI